MELFRLSLLPKEAENVSDNSDKIRGVIKLPGQVSHQVRLPLIALQIPCAPSSPGENAFTWLLCLSLLLYHLPRGLHEVVMKACKACMAAFASHHEPVEH